MNYLPNIKKRIWENFLKSKFENKYQTYENLDIKIIEALN